MASGGTYRVKTVFDNVFFDFLEEVGGKNKVVERLIVGRKYKVFITGPFAVPFIDEYDIFADAEHRVHIVGIDDGSDIVFVRDIAEQFVYEYGCLGVEAAVGLIAEQVARVQRYGASDGDTFLHTAGYFAGILVFGA